MTATTLATRDLAPRIATEIRADKENLLSGVHAGAIRELLEQRGVLVFPQVGFTDEEQVTLDTAVNSQPDYLKGSLYWHIDGTMNEAPFFASLLSGKALPRNGGGDNEFCNTYAAYEDLPNEDKQPLESLRAMHST
jgi:alpha-ketoglutarate-dependent taurine dioxygenase